MRVASVARRISPRLIAEPVLARLVESGGNINSVDGVVWIPLLGLLIPNITRCLTSWMACSMLLWLALGKFVGVHWKLLFIRGIEETEEKYQQWEHCKLSGLSIANTQ